MRSVNKRDFLLFWKYDNTSQPLNFVDSENSPDKTYYMNLDGPPGLTR